MVKKRLYRSTKERIIAGVCGGLAEYFNLDPTLIRLAWAVLTVFSFGAGVFAYIVAWIIVPEK
ncbi:PspC domain-containing protein [Candidatus Woesearchaeota archaeon]|nr:PspC domain-containing protein [Candidatus Woesearchaeota archaeon]